MSNVPDHAPAPSSPPQANDEDSMLPVPSRSDRWQPLRGGVLNIYRFDYEEFHYERGRLLLRGNNGAGKSRLLALQLPFLLDGEATPARFEPDGDPAKRIEWNLLMGRHADRTGYTWIEFGRRGPDDGEAVYLTLGCGMRAVAGQSGLRARWFFLTPQRVGRDLFLQNAAGQPLGRERLEEALAPSGRLFTRTDDYRRTVDAELFGLGERYPRLIDLLIRLRRPQLSRKLDEEELSQTLSDALPVLPAAIVEVVAEAFRGLQTDRDAWQGFCDMRDAVGAFLREYRRYTRTALRRRGAAVRSDHAAVEDAQRRVRDAERRATAAGDALQRLTAEQAQREQDLAAAEETERTLRSSPEMRTADELDQAARAVTTATAAREQAAQDMASAEREAIQANTRREEAERRLAGIRQTTEQALRTAEAHALKADLLELHRDQLANPFAGDEDSRRGVMDVAARALDGEVTRRRQGIALLRRRDAELAAARAAFDAAETRRRHADEACSAARERERAAREALDAAAAALQRAYHDWHNALRELTCPTADELAEAFALWMAQREGPSPLQSAASMAHRATVARITVEDTELGLRLAAEQLRRNDIQAELSSLEQGGTTPPPPPPTDRAERAGRAGAPLWRLCDFAPGTSNAQRAGLESALQASGLLDAWLLPDGRLLDTDTEDTFLLGEPPAAGRHLGTVLVPAIDAADPGSAALTAATVERVLAAIGVGRDQGTHWVDPDGSWRLGPLTGRWTKPAAEFIGASSREQARRRRMGELRATLAELDARCREIESARAALTNRRSRADEELRSLPLDALVLEAGFEMAAAVRATADTFTAHERAEQDAARARGEADEALRRRDTDAGDCGLSAWLGRLDELQDAVADYAAAVQGLWPTLRHWESEQRQLRLATEAAEAATAQRRLRAARRQTAAEAAAAAISRQRVLQETHGASIAAILGKLAETENQIRIMREESRCNQVHVVGETSARDTARQDAAHADSERERHETERAAAITELQRFAEQRLLSEADEELADIESAGWSVTRAVEIARLIEPRLADTPHDDERWRHLQDTIHSHIQELRDRLVAQGHQPESHALADFVVVRCLFQGRPHTMSELHTAFAAEVSERERLLAAREKEIIENHLLGEVAVELQKLVRSAEEWIASANGELASRPTSTGLRFRFAWDTIEESGFGAIRRPFLRTSELWSPAERSALAQFLHGRIRAAQDADQDGSWRDHLASALDYRRWHRFIVERQQEGQWRRLDRRTYGTGSGGEKALALTLPRFAAAAAYYRGAAPHAPRLIMLDEAFAGIDPTMRAQCLGVLEQFDLDVVMTSELEWGCYPTVPGLAIYHLSAFPGIDAVGITRWVWNGRERRSVDVPLPPSRPAAMGAARTSSADEETLFADETEPSSRDA